MIKQIFQAKAKIVYNKRIKDSYFKSILSSPRIALGALPGQFVNIKVNECHELLLRRPFSVHRISNSNIEILYEVVGKGTEILSQRKLGEFLDIIGPLGNGFDLNRQTGKSRMKQIYAETLRDPEVTLKKSLHSGPANRQTILVAGGMGVAALYFLAERLADCKLQIANCKILVLIGAKTKKQILCEKEFKELGCEVKIATDDGSKGFKGKITELLKKILRLAISDKRLAIYACGPRPMLKEIAVISKKYNIPAQISLEEHMACGIGACLGCVVNTKEGYKRVCKEGPVFKAKEIIW